MTFYTDFTCKNISFMQHVEFFKSLQAVVVFLGIYIRIVKKCQHGIINVINTNCLNYCCSCI